MGNCLVTKLKGSVSNNELLRIGEIRAKIVKVSNPTNLTQGIKVTVNKPVQWDIIGDGYFTNSLLTDNLGNKITLNEGVNYIYVSNSNCELGVLGKYNITSLELPIYGKNISFNLSSLDWVRELTKLSITNSFVYGDVGALEKLIKLTEFYAGYTQVSGDIGGLGNLTSLTKLGLSYTQVSGDIGGLGNLTSLTTLGLSYTQVSGDIGGLGNLTSLTTLDLLNTQVSGDIGGLGNLTSLTTLKVVNEQTPLTGNIESFSNFQQLKEITLKKSNLTGDLSSLPAPCRFASFTDDKGSRFTWSTRPSSAKIIAIEGNAKLTNIDKMLQDQSKCQVGFTAEDNAWYKTISVVGSRTSASDTAVQELQNKGYTVSITPA